MNESELIAFYEKQYIYELEMREKLTSRLQIPITLIVTIAGVFAFILQRYELTGFRFTSSHLMFLFFVAASVLALAIALRYVIAAWVNNAYHFMPFPKQTADYQLLLEQTYSGYPQCEALVQEYMRSYLIKQYVDDATFNAQVNDMRSDCIDRANQLIIVTAAFLLVAFVAFQSGDLDHSKMDYVQALW